MQNLNYYIPGVILILIALLIIALPEILVAFASAIMIFLGIGLLTLGHRLRKSELRFDQSNDYTFEDHYFGHRFARSPVFRRWFRRY